MKKFQMSNNFSTVGKLMDVDICQRDLQKRPETVLRQSQATIYTPT